LAYQTLSKGGVTIMYAVLDPYQGLLDHPSRHLERIADRLDPQA